MSPTATASLLDGVHELEARVQAAKGEPERVAHDRQQALVKAARAREALRGFYARDKRDAKLEAKLKAAVDQAEAEESDRWDDRLLGANMAEGVARDKLAAFIRANFAKIAAELLPACAQVTERFERAREALDEAVRERQRLLDEWRVLIGPVDNIDASELPDDQSIEPPMPRSLAGLLSEQASELEAA